MYDLDGKHVPANFNQAIQQRPNYEEITCESTGLPLFKQYTFDKSENISSIVTDV